MKPGNQFLNYLLHCRFWRKSL